MGAARCGLRRLCIVLLLFGVLAKPRVHISDDLDDVPDSEEPEEWKRDAPKAAPTIAGVGRAANGTTSSC